VVDNLLMARIVMVNGEIPNASQTENQDLFWAIRGSGSNFGVVTSFTFKGYPKPPVVYKPTLVFAHSQLPQLLEVINKLYSDGLTKNMGTLVAFAQELAGPGLITSITYIGTEVEA
jgi:FAD/FMN-containing dehydrogenase